jgi:hypothetical protein
MMNLNTMTEADVRAELVRIAERKAKQLAYNKQWRETHEQTPEAKATRLAYNKKYNAKKRAFEQALRAKASELGIA